jgi:signal transduction histidine kinase
MLGNLIGNAVKFCRPGERVAIESHVGAGEVELVVIDSGPGIAKDDLPHIFDRYWSAKHHQATGTGLGLYISKGIVDAHGGRIWVESTLGTGTAFHVVLHVAARGSDTAV